MRKSLLLVTTLAALAAAAPASARDAGPPTRTVETADLDLSTPAGQHKLERRIAAATQAVCGAYAGARDGEEDRIAECRARVAGQVRPAVVAATRRAQAVAWRD